MAQRKETKKTIKVRDLKPKKMQGRLFPPEQSSKRQVTKIEPPANHKLHRQGQ